MDSDMSCSGKYCRAVPDAGSAVQVVLASGDEARYCWKCFQRWERETFPLSYEEGMP